MILPEKIQKKAEGFGKLAPAFLEGAKFALENQWISIDDDLPCNHEELLDIEDKEHTLFVVASINGYIMLNIMYKFNDKWYWRNYEPDYWMPIPKLPKTTKVPL